MTVSSTTRRAGPFYGNGVTTAFPFAFKVLSAGDLELTHTNAAGVASVISSGFSVTLNADQDANPGGTITYPLSGAPMANPESLVAIGAAAFTQPTDITNAGRFLPQALENALDRVTMLVQQIEELTGRQLLIPADGPYPVTTLPYRQARYDRLLKFDDLTGQPNVSSFTHTQVASAIAAAYAGAAGPLDALSFLQGGVGAVSRTAQDKARDAINVKDFGAVGDGVTDDTAAIQKAINYAMSTNGVRRILFQWNHLVTDLNLTKLFNCGLILEGQNASNQDGSGSNAKGTFIVTGATSQGLDLSGSEGIVSRDITIAGDVAAPPRCGIFMARVVGNPQCPWHGFDNVNTYGEFTHAAVYNYAGEGHHWIGCTLKNSSTVGHTYYGTSKNSLGLTSKFQTLDETKTPLTVTTFDACTVINADGAVGATATYGLWFERDRVRGGDRTISNIAFRGGYRNGFGIASLFLQDVDNTVSYHGVTDESFATGIAHSNSYAIKIACPNYLIGLSIVGSTFFGGASKIISGDNLRNFDWKRNYVYNGKGVQLTNLDGAHVALWLTAGGTFQVTGTATQCYIYPENIGTFPYIDLNGFANCALADRVLNSPGALVPSVSGQLAYDYAQGRPYVAQPGGTWNEMLQVQRSNAAPTSGNSIYGQITTLYGFPLLARGGALGLVCVNSGTAGALVGVTGTITTGTKALVLNTAAGVSVGNYITIAGVTGRKQITALSGLNATIDANADASVAGAAVAYSAPDFAEWGSVKLQATTAWTPGLIASGSKASASIAVGSAAMGDLAVVSFSLDLAGCSISAYVAAAGSVVVVITNNTGAGVTLGAGTITARVFKQ